jgi:hypothetical protein
MLPSVGFRFTLIKLKFHIKNIPFLYMHVKPNRDADLLKAVGQLLQEELQRRHGRKVIADWRAGGMAQGSQPAAADDADSAARRGRLGWAMTGPARRIVG